MRMEQPVVEQGQMQGMKQQFHFRSDRNSKSKGEGLSVGTSLQFNFINTQHRNQNVKMQKDYIAILKQFYQVVTQKSDLKTDRLQFFQAFLSRFQSSQKNIKQILPQTKGTEYDTQASLGVFQSFSFNSQPALTASSNMLFTFIVTNSSHQLLEDSKNTPNVISRNTFADKSIFRVLIYALFINLAHINQFSAEKQNSGESQLIDDNARMTVKKLKVAMVSAAQSFKSRERRKYLKIRYLYDQLLAYTQNGLMKSEHYIRVIVREFDEDYLKKVFQMLTIKYNELFYSRSMSSSLSLENPQPTDGCLMRELDYALDYLKVRLSVDQKGRNCGREESDSSLHIILRSTSDGEYKLSEILTFRNHME